QIPMALAPKADLMLQAVPDPGIEVTVLWANVTGIEGLIIGRFGKTSVPCGTEVSAIKARTLVIPPIGRSRGYLGILDKKGAFAIVLGQLLRFQCIGHPLGLLMRLAIGKCE